MKKKSSKILKKKYPRFFINQGWFKIKYVIFNHENDNGTVVYNDGNISPVISWTEKDFEKSCETAKTKEIMIEEAALL